MLKFSTAEILCVGTEILIGDIVNTNAAFISARLADIGINQYYQSVVGDNPVRLAECVKTALSRCDLLIMSGGLGPTYDDLTKETAAAAMGRALILDQPSLDRISGFFCHIGKEMTPNNLKQAYIPEGSVIFENNNGTAPGCCIEDELNGKGVIMLPGPPSELIPMWNESVEPYLRARSSVTLFSRNIKLSGIGESQVENLLRPLMEAAENPTVAPYCKEGEVRLRVTARADTQTEGARLCDEMVSKICSGELGPYVYGVDVELAEAVIALLRKKGLHLATAESCTGGLIAEMITDVPGSSDVFDGSVVSYSNHVKRDTVGVSAEALDRFGAVSEPVAAEMAKGIRSVIGADIGVGVTGIAGPGGGSAEKPVGLVYIAVATEKNCTVRKCSFTGNRARIRRLSAVTALTMTLEAARGNEGNGGNGGTQAFEKA